MIIRRIEVLEPQVANKIAAGEVVERPASVVKELVENALDAGASAVTVEIREGGTEYIRVTDNGCGIPCEDVKTAFLRHATSKLRSAEGLDGIETLGFRGEALASIAAVSHVTMRTATQEEEHGTMISLDGGEVRECLPCGCPIGTSIEIRELFYNVPARLKFLKSARAEAAAVGDYMLRLILGNTGVSFKFINNGKPVYHSAGDGSLENALACVYGSDLDEHLKKVRYDDGYILIDGFCGDESVSRSNRVQQSIFVNGRYIRSQQISYAAQRAYNTRLMVGRFPFLMLNVRISPREVDVNVHPNKLTVRFRDEERIFTAVMTAVRDALNGVTAEELPLAELKEHRTVAPDMYSVFRRDREAEKSIPVPDIPREEIKLPAVEKQEAFETAEEIKDEPIYVKDSSFGTPVVETVDPNGVLHYDFTVKPEIKEEHFEKIEFDLSPYTIVGIAFDTYIIVEQGDALYYIDQHAAHERILYEKLIKDELRFDSQILLVSKVIKLTPTEHECLIENMERFRELGFEIEEFGSYTVSVHAIPSGIRKESAEKLVRDMIAVIKRQGAVTELDLVRSSLIQASCKHAIKAGYALDKRGIDEILSHYADGSTPLTCPHGRPIMCRVSKRDFEKMFKRIT
ncbi:MAG: DNA mismatch repair endonuclease MutL [Clostridiales bacterium]|nr:DNA mismatch repair endonuclease MutL [Clostridiales bacterium]